MRVVQQQLIAHAQTRQLDSQTVHSESSTKGLQGSGQCPETTRQQQLLYRTGEPQQSVNGACESQVQHSLIKQLRAPSMTFAADRKPVAPASSKQIKQQQHLSAEVTMHT